AAVLGDRLTTVIQIIHDSNVEGVWRADFEEVDRSSVNYPVVAEFQATTNTVTFNAATVTGTVIRGDGTPSETYVSIKKSPRSLTGLFDLEKQAQYYASHGTVDVARNTVTDLTTFTVTKSSY